LVGPDTATEAASPPVSRATPGGSSRAIEAPVEEEKKKSGGLFAVLAVVALGGVGAALWFLHVIPH
jgi:hypothetical protein